MTVVELELSLELDSSLELLSTSVVTSVLVMSVVEVSASVVLVGPAVVDEELDSPPDELSPPSPNATSVRPQPSRPHTAATPIARAVHPAVRVEATAEAPVKTTGRVSAGPAKLSNPTGPPQAHERARPRPPGPHDIGYGGLSLARAESRARAARVPTQPMDDVFSSKLPEPRQRFLAQVVEHGLRSGLRTPEEFLRHFSPLTIMHALGEEPARRARILETTVGTRPKIALKKSPESSGEDLRIALEEGETTAAAVLEQFEADDRVRFLDAQYLWTFVVEPRFWLHTATSTDRLQKIRSHTAYLVQTAIAEGLVTERDVVRAISVGTLVECMPREEVANLIERALLDGRDRTPFSERTLLEVLGVRGIIDHVPLATIWEWVVGAKIAVPQGFAPDAEPLFDEREAHPDAQDVTVIVGGQPELAAAGGLERG